LKEIIVMATGTYNMRQCNMRRPSELGHEVQRAWIPEKFAVAGKFLELQNKATGEWENGWEVVGVGTGVLKSDIVNERSQDYKNTRKASDA
jgi:hypothetical protein